MPSVPFDSMHDVPISDACKKQVLTIVKYPSSKISTSDKKREMEDGIVTSVKIEGWKNIWGWIDGRI